MSTGAEPRFRRPAAADAIDVARELLDEGERVDVLAVARRLGVSRATVHRWFGTRERLLAALFETMAAEFIAAAEAEARGEGDARALDFVRRLAETAVAYEPLRIAALSEPGIVLRTVVAPDGPVRPQIALAVDRLLAESRTPAQMQVVQPAVETFIDAVLALHWATVAAGGDPDIAAYERIGRALLADAERS